MWSNWQLWTLRLRVSNINLWLPVPVFVLTELLASWSDLCEVILPRLGYPNYAGMLYALVMTLTDFPPGESMLDISTGDVHLRLRRVGREGM